ncbi:hypothetical protein AB433_07680 [Croceicoccus naphthovorans]|uniref:Uncharacterized protein n=1 Tax=Croceicoccus naphthovorans TaxID=1348774 RepID=A0A0G3XFA3_9SPHN|nr:hypothetical protein AB433_07680 [Croceicoccus naphthovorans]
MADSLIAPVPGTKAPEKVEYPDEVIFAGSPLDYANAMIDALILDKAGWEKFGVEQTGQLKKANRDKADIVKTVGDCEARDRAAVRNAQPRFKIF